MGIRSPPPPSIRGHAGQDAAHLLGVILHLQAVTSFFAFSLLKDTEITGWNCWAKAGLRQEHPLPMPSHHLQEVPHELQTWGLCWHWEAPLAAGDSQDPRGSPWQRPQRAVADGPGNQALPGLARVQLWDSAASWHGPAQPGLCGAAFEAMAAPLSWCQGRASWTCGPGRAEERGARLASDGPTRSCAAIPSLPRRLKTDWSHLGNPGVPQSQKSRQNKPPRTHWR